MDRCVPERRCEKTKTCTLPPACACCPLSGAHVSGGGVMRIGCAIARASSARGAPPVAPARAAAAEVWVASAMSRAKRSAPPPPGRFAPSLPPSPYTTTCVQNLSFPHAATASGQLGDLHRFTHIIHRSGRTSGGEKSLRSTHPLSSTFLHSTPHGSKSLSSCSGACAAGTTVGVPRSARRAAHVELPARARAARHAAASSHAAMGFSD